jgi:predicted nucleic acid-binding protein
MSDRFFIDTNILVYANDNTEVDKNRVSKEIIFNGMQNENIVLSTQVLSEFYVTVTKKIERTLSSGEAQKEITLFRSIELAEISIDLILQAIDLSKHYKISYCDALIIAAAIDARCTIIYSEDLSSGQQFESTRIINPYL